MVNVPKQVTGKKKKKSRVLTQNNSFITCIIIEGKRRYVSLIMGRFNLYY